MEGRAQKNNPWPGPVEILILRVLSQGDLHGYGIVQFIQRSSGNSFLTEEGSLYPALQGLELHGWIHGVWGVTQAHRRARIYKITPSGRKQLDTLLFDKCDSHIGNAPIVSLKNARSCILFGCVVTGAAFGRQSAQNVPSSAIPVNVCLEPKQDLPIDTTAAESLVSVIFSQIGVNLTWHSRLSDCERSVPTAFKIRWAEDAPSTSPASALAAAHLFGSSETSITLYEIPMDRFLRHQYRNAPEVVLAYVLAHELAHVMQGLDRHSDSGILKAIWCDFEYNRMTNRSLTFTAQDVVLIRAGLQKKRLNVASRESPFDSSGLVR